MVEFLMTYKSGSSMHNCFKAPRWQVFLLRRRRRYTYCPGAAGFRIFEYAAVLEVKQVSKNNNQHVFWEQKCNGNFAGISNKKLASEFKIADTCTKRAIALIKIIRTNK